MVIFGLRGWADGVGNVYRNRVAGAHDAIRWHSLTCDGHLAVLDETLNLRPGLAAKNARQVSVEAHARFVCGDEQIVAKHNVIA